MNFVVYLIPLFAYLLGSLSASLWITRRLKGVDVRQAGSGHATTTNTIRQAGWVAGAAVLLFDIVKGFIPVWLALRLGAPAWLVGLTAAAAVAGHCWPLFYGFQGGMGLATAGGGFLAVSWLGFLIGFAILLAVVLVTRHGARGSVIAAVLIAPALWLLGFPAEAVWVAALTGLVAALRFTVDWHREYRELWLDREGAAG